MIKSILSLVIATTTALSLAAPTQARMVRTDISKEAIMGLVKTGQRLGIQFQVDTPDCKENARLMGYMVAPQMVMTVCLKNHEAYGDMAVVNLADTIRHELIHAAQFCKATYSSNVLFPDRINESLDFAQEHLDWNVLGYPVQYWNAEGEARTLAHHFSEQQVSVLLDKSCRYSDTNQSMIGDIRIGRTPITGTLRPEKHR
jgi:hypothetical protein